ncbi:MAG TPA: hypothetical protein VKZ81_12930 [Pseudonocardia sp.]|uniref:hypothetical protein n=1 Tax=Pseudonocardia sp. TaxID=60912 RepID=UPI002B4B5D1C|nr:hypothetical protein [Pseudonocardia sp.]HLU56358.1 hypothetical protein [Pseudonocardia sp.]
MTAGRVFDVIDFMEKRPALVAELLRVHVDDGTGRCAGCSWRTAAVPNHPCAMRWYAERADESLRARRARDDASPARGRRLSRAGRGRRG